MHPPGQPLKFRHAGPIRRMHAAAGTFWMALNQRAGSTTRTLRERAAVLPDGSLIRFNLVFYRLEVLRAPLLGTLLTIKMVLKIVIVSTILLGVSALQFARTRGRAT